MSDALRIMVVLPLYGGSLPIGQYCAKSLAALGHSVRVFEAQELYPAFLGIKKLDLAPARISALENGFLKFVSQAIWTQAQEQSPQLILALAQAPIDRPLLQKFRQMGIYTVMWFVEDYRVFNYWKIYAPLYDAFAVIQKEPFLSLLKETGQEHAFYLPLAALPDFHKPMDLTPREKKEYGSDISFLGAGYPNRRIAFRRLAGKNFKIWGSDWEGETILAPHIQRNGQRIDPEESVKIYNAAKININLHSSLSADQIVGNGDFVNPRTFELAAMGAFQLVDKRSLMGELFEEGELATFDNMDDFYKKIDYFIDHPEERKKYAEKARIRTLKDHTYDQRMSRLVDYMLTNFPGLKEEVKKPDDGQRDNFASLIEGLGLPPNAAFEDVVARIRRQKGTLNEMETAILFLDEWKKQYA